jgi:Tudor domain
MSSTAGTSIFVIFNLGILIFLDLPGSVAGSRVGGPITVVKAERRGIFLHIFCYRNADLNAIELLMTSLSEKFEFLPPVENELDIEGKLLAVKIGNSWLRASGQRNCLVNLIDVGMKKKVALENIRHALPEMQRPQITFWCVLSNFFAHCGENQVEEAMQSMVC